MLPDADVVASAFCCGYGLRRWAWGPESLIEGWAINHPSTTLLDPIFRVARQSCLSGGSTKNANTMHSARTGYENK